MCTFLKVMCHAVPLAGVSQLVEFGVALELWRVHVRDFAVWLVAFVVTTFAGVEMGLLASICLSVLILILEVSFPHTAVLGRLGKTNVYRWAISSLYLYNVHCYVPNPSLVQWRVLAVLPVLAVVHTAQPG
jgi:MFS superfamily sulfate permease-like transporter